MIGDDVVGVTLSNVSINIFLLGGDIFERRTEITSNIIVLYILILKFLQRSPEGKIGWTE